VNPAKSHKTSAITTGIIAKFHHPLITKGAIALLLAILAFIFFQINQDLVKANRKMLKYIKNEDAFKQNLLFLRKNVSQFAPYIVSISGKGAQDLEKEKSLYMNQLLDLAKGNELKVDSYNTEIDDKEGTFVTFRYQISLIGDFVRIIQFFSQIQKETRHIYIRSYEIRKHVRDNVRLGMTAEVVAAPLELK